MPLDVVVEFKRGVYEMALTELSRFVPRCDFRMDSRGDHRTHYLRSGAPRSCDALGQPGMPSMAEMPAFRFGGVFELPPGATFEPDPGTSMECGHKVTKA